MYYAHYDSESGKILGFYTDTIHETIPTPNIQLTVEQWKDCVANTEERRVSESQVVVHYEEDSLDVIKENCFKNMSYEWKRQIDELGMATAFGFSVNCDINDAIIWEQGVNFLDSSVETVRVRAIDDTFHYIPKADYETIPAMQQQFYAFCLQKKWDLQEQIMNATTKEEAEAVTWNIDDWWTN